MERLKLQAGSEVRVPILEPGVEVVDLLYVLGPGGEFEKRSAQMGLYS